VLYRTLELTLAPALRALYRPQITGFEHVPHTGPVVFAANHVSFADEVFAPLAARRQVYYFAKAEYFTTPGIRGRAMATFFHGMGHPVAEWFTPEVRARYHAAWSQPGEGGSGAAGWLPPGRACSTRFSSARRSHRSACPS